MGDASHWQGILLIASVLINAGLLWRLRHVEIDNVHKTNMIERLNDQIRRRDFILEEERGMLEELKEYESETTRGN